MDNSETFYQQLAAFVFSDTQNIDEFNRLNTLYKEHCKKPFFKLEQFKDNLSYHNIKKPDPKLEKLIQKIKLNLIGHNIYNVITQTLNAKVKIIIIIMSEQKLTLTNFEKNG